VREAQDFGRVALVNGAGCFLAMPSPVYCPDFLTGQNLVVSAEAWEVKQSHFPFCCFC